MDIGNIIGNIVCASNIFVGFKEGTFPIMKDFFKNRFLSPEWKKQDHYTKLLHAGLSCGNVCLISNIKGILYGFLYPLILLDIVIVPHLFGRHLIPMSNPYMFGTLGHISGQMIGYDYNHPEFDFDDYYEGYKISMEDLIEDYNINYKNINKLHHRINNLF